MIIAGSLVPNVQTGTTYTVLSSDHGRLIVFTNSSAVAVTLPQANSTTFQNGFNFQVYVSGAGTVTITPTTSTIDGAATLALTQGQSTHVASDGTNYRSSGLGGGVPSSGVNAQTGTTYTYLASDKGKLVTHSNASAIAGTLPQATGDFGSGWWVDVENRGTGGTLTITPTTSTIDGAATLVLRTNQGARIVSDGTNYFTLRGMAAGGVDVNAQTGTTYTVLTTDRGKLVTHTNASAIAVTLPQATGNFGANFHFWAQNRGAGTVTITPTTSTIDGAASLALTTNQGALIVSDGTNWFTMRGVGSSSGVQSRWFGV